MSKLKSIIKTNITISTIKGQSKYKSKEKIDWKGFYRYYGYFFAQYLNKKYDNVCIKPGLTLSFQMNDINITFEGKTVIVGSKSPINNMFFDFIKNCKKRFVVIPITIYSHQNILIYDTKLKEVELFDSYGKNSLYEFQKELPLIEQKQFMNSIFNSYYIEIEYLFKNVDKKIKFFKPISFFPDDKEFQNFEINVCPKEKFNINSWGFCVVWSFWYAENRLRYPNKSRKELVKTLLDLFHKDTQTIKKSVKNKNLQEKINLHLPICKIIRGYTSFLQNLDKDLSFFQKLKLDFKLHKDIYYLRAKLYTFMIAFFSLYGYTLYKLR